ncbi:hypothetical protein D9M73_175250 [compost metagenome]
MAAEGIHPRGGDAFGTPLVLLLHQQRHAAQGFLLHAAPVVVVDQQAVGRHQQVGARFLQLRQVILAEQPGEGVVGGVRRVVRAAELLAQPAEQPAVVAAVERGERGGGRSGHDADLWRERRAK